MLLRNVSYWAHVSEADFVYSLLCRSVTQRFLIFNQSNKVFLQQSISLHSTPIIPILAKEEEVHITLIALEMSQEVA